MKLNSILIQNYGSIRDIEINDIGELSVLVGRNGSGKTSIFSALELFFGEFQVSGGDSAVKEDDYIWHRRNTNNDIVIEVSLQLTEPEFIKLGPHAGFSEEETISELGKNPIIHARRCLKFRNGWTTALMKLGTKTLIEEDQPISELPTESAPEPPNLSKWQLVLFDPDATKKNIVGSRLLVNLAQKTAFHSNSDIDSLSAKYGLKVVLDHRDQELGEWVSSQELQYQERVPNESEAEEIFAALQHSMEEPTPRKIAPDFGQIISYSFSLIPVARDSREHGTHRPPLLDQNHMTRMKELSLSRKLPDETKWGKFGHDVEVFIEKRLEPNPDQLLIVDKGLRLPLSFMGGGEQSLIGLEWRLLEGFQILAIEEPENHLHPDLIRKLFEFLKSMAHQTQILLSTHSNFLVDKSEPTSNWRVFIQNNETTIERCHTNDDLRNVLIDLGVLPSDILFRDKVVFVEGGTEKESVLPILAGKLGLQLEDNLSIGIISIGGEGRLKDNLRIWLEVVKHAPAKYLVIVDNHSAGLVTDISKEMSIPMEMFYILSEHAIEDYYPPRYLVEAMKVLYEIDIESKDLRKKEGESRATTIKKFLEESGKIENGWKVRIGAYVASRMKPSEIPDDLSTALKRIVE